MNENCNNWNYLYDALATNKRDWEGNVTSEICKCGHPNAFHGKFDVFGMIYDTPKHTQCCITGCKCKKYEGKQ